MSDNVTTLATIPSQELVEFAKPIIPAGKRKPQVVLQEEEYVSGLEKIIQRDFFPEHEKLKAQYEYLDALERNDLDKLREISLRHNTPLDAMGHKNARRDKSTSSFETPSGVPSHASTPSGSSVWNDHEGEKEVKRVKKEKPKFETNMSLDQFLSKYTSEDNASFDEILEATNRNLKQQFEQLFGKVQEKEAQLMLAGGEKAAGVTYMLDHWRYEPKNQLMWNPAGKEFSAKELVAISKQKHNTIAHSNTRFQRTPFGGSSSVRSVTSGRTSGSRHGVVLLGENGASVFNREAPDDGNATPNVKGYKFVATPSPVPGKDMDPLMTFGLIEGTPRAVHGDIAAASGPVFQIPEMSQRDKLARKMADDSSRKRRERSGLTRTPVGSRGLTPASRLTTMSPAAQKLARQMTGGSSSSLNSALRQKYSSTGDNRRLGARLTPRVTPRITPKVTPKATPQSSRQATPSGAGGIKDTSTNITDNLL